MVETVLTFTAFLFLTFGLMEFSMAVFAYNFCSYSARDAARYASVHGAKSVHPTDGVELSNIVKRQAIGMVASRLSVNTEWIPDSNPGSQVKVTVSYEATPLVGLAIPQDMRLSSSSQIMIVH